MMPNPTPHATPAPLNTVIVVGASVAGVAAAEALRKKGFDGSLIIADASSERPHDKPALSKEILTADLDEDDIELITDERARELGIELALGDPAVGIDPESRTVTFRTRQIKYDGAIIATGSRARLPPVLNGLEGVHVMRNLADARAIAGQMREGQPRVAVVGGGFIGCEVASSANQMGLDVTIIESCDHILSRVLTPELAMPILRMHRDRGVQIVNGKRVVGLVGSQRVSGVQLADSSVVSADLVVIGVGTTPCTHWLHGSGLQIDDGIVTDASLLTSAPGVFAAGDVARRRSRAGARGIRTEHWTDAREQGRLAARNLVSGSSEAYQLPSYVWSDQFGRRVQLAGKCDGPVEFLSGGGADEPYVAVSRRRDGAVSGVVAFDDAIGFRQARKMLTDPTAGTATPAPTGSSGNPRVAPEQARMP